MGYRTATTATVSPFTAATAAPVFAPAQVTVTDVITGVTRQVAAHPTGDGMVLVEVTDECGAPVAVSTITGGAQIPSQARPGWQASLLAAIHPALSIA